MKGGTGWELTKQSQPVPPFANVSRSQSCQPDTKLVSGGESAPDAKDEKDSCKKLLKYHSKHSHKLQELCVPSDMLVLQQNNNLGD